MVNTRSVDLADALHRQISYIAVPLPGPMKDGQGRSVFPGTGIQRVWIGYMCSLMFRPHPQRQVGSPVKTLPRRNGPVNATPLFGLSMMR